MGHVSIFETTSGGDVHWRGAESLRVYTHQEVANEKVVETFIIFQPENP